MVLKGPKRKRKRELAKKELQLKRKCAKTDKLQQRQGPLLEDAGEQQIVFKKNSKRDKGNHESNARNGQSLNPSRSSLDESCMNPECEGNGHSQSSKDGQDLNLESISNGQQFNSKKRKKEQRSNSERSGIELHSNSGGKNNSKSDRSIQGQELPDAKESNEETLKESMHIKKKTKTKKKRDRWGQEQKSNSERSGKELHSNSGENDNLKSDCSIQGQELSDAKDINEDTVEPSMHIKKKTKTKKKRDRWGQVLNEAGNTQDSCYDDKDSAKLDNVGKPDNAAHTTGNETLGECASHKGEYDNKTVCAGGMPYDTSEEDIQLFFKECGAVARVGCTKFADTQRFKGLAFITFETETAAAKALSLDGANMGDRHIKVERARAGGKVLQAPPKREAGSLSVYVGNLDWGVEKIDVKRFFKGCNIDNVRLAVDKNTGEFRGYGHVDLSDEESLEKAIKMNQKQLFGRPVKVSYAVPKGFKGKSS